jgi:hypothetical protein
LRKKAYSGLLHPVEEAVNWIVVPVGTGALGLAATEAEVQGGPTTALLEVRLE